MAQKWRFPQQMPWRAGDVLREPAAVRERKKTPAHAVVSDGHTLFFSDKTHEEQRPFAKTGSGQNKTDTNHDGEGKH